MMTDCSCFQSRDEPSHAPRPNFPLSFLLASLFLLSLALHLHLEGLAYGTSSRTYSRTIGRMEHLGPWLA